MDSDHFDRLTRVLAGVRSRRGVVQLVAATVGLGGLTLVGLQDALPGGGSTAQKGQNPGGHESVFCSLGLQYRAQRLRHHGDR